MMASKTLTSQKNSTELLNTNRNNENLIDILQVVAQKNKQHSMPCRIAPSSALSAVKSFLPKMAQANVKLQEKIASESLEAVNIENTDNCEGPIIEMNIALYEQKSDNSESDEFNSSCTDSSSDTDSDDSSTDSTLFGEVNETNLKLFKKSKLKQAAIEELN